MNLHVRQHPPMTTQAAEGLPRRAWTIAEIERMVAAGIIADHERIELIGGEVVPMSPKGRRHELVADELARYWAPRISPEFWVSVERQFDLDGATYTDPDLLVRPAAIKIPDVRGDTALLVVEIADSSLLYDQTTKAALYARFGVREYWVINAQTLETRVHREPSPAGYVAVRNAPAIETLTPFLVPILSVKLAELDLV